MSEDHYVSARDAARVIAGISRDTWRRWDAADKIQIERDETNRRIVAAAELKRRVSGSAYAVVKSASMMIE